MSRMFLLFQLTALCLLLGCSGGDKIGVDDGSQKPANAISWTPEAVTKGTTVSFSISGNADNIRSVLWTFGDSQVVTSMANSPVEHVYTTAGKYTVSAYISWETTSMTELVTSITVLDAEAEIACSNTTPARMETVQFALNEVADVRRVVWDFGDQSAAQQVTLATAPVTHQYTTDGAYQVQAVITYADTSSQTLSQRVEVEGASLSYACKNFDKSKVWIMAHRGNFKGGYELAPNSLSAYRKCVSLGYVEFIETDAQITQDGAVICLHDKYLSRFTNYNNYASDEGYVANFTLDALGKYSLKTTDGTVVSEGIPTLEAVLTEFRGEVWFNIDKCSDTDKTIEEISKIYEVVKKCGCLDRVQFYVGNAGSRNAQWLSQRSIPAILAPHANSTTQLTTMTAYQPYYMIQTSTATLEGNISWLSTVNTTALSVTNLLDAYSASFLAGNTTLMDSFVGAGLNMVQCDYPPEVYSYLQKKGKR